jgi:hypothetical protein
LLSLLNLHTTLQGLWSPTPPKCLFAGELDKHLVGDGREVGKHNACEVGKHNA